MGKMTMTSPAMISPVETSPTKTSPAMLSPVEQVQAAARAVARSTLALLDLIGQVDATDSYLPLYSNTAAWVRWHLGVDHRTARIYVATARRFDELNRIRRAFGDGRLSFGQLQLVLRVATVDNQDELLKLVGDCADIDELRQAIRDHQAVEAAEEETSPDPEPHLRTWWTGDRLTLNGVIPGADGVMVEQAILRLSNRAPKDPRTGLFRHPETLAAEAIVQMASESLAADGDHDRATIVVHIAASDLVNKSGFGWDASSRLFTPGEIERLLCDARLQPSLHDSDGITVGVGRTTRTVEPWLRRLVMGRDQGCRFPGCQHKRWLHCHHLIPWAQDGHTNLDSLIALCGFHHRLIHNEGWIITGNPNRELVFINKFGLRHGPPPRPFPAGNTAVRQRMIDEKAGRRLDQLTAVGPAP